MFEIKYNFEKLKELINTFKGIFENSKKKLECL